MKTPGKNTSKRIMCCANHRFIYWLAGIVIAVELWSAMFITERFEKLCSSAHNQKSETVCKMNFNGILLHMKQPIADKGKRGQKRDK